MASPLLQRRQRELRSTRHRHRSAPKAASAHRRQPADRAGRRRRRPGRSPSCRLHTRRADRGDARRPDRARNDFRAVLRRRRSAGSGCRRRPTRGRCGAGRSGGRRGDPPGPRRTARRVSTANGCYGTSCGRARAGRKRAADRRPPQAMARVPRRRWSWRNARPSTPGPRSSTAAASSSSRPSRSSPACRRSCTRCRRTRRATGWRWPAGSSIAENPLVGRVRMNRYWAGVLRPRTRAHARGLRLPGRSRRAIPSCSTGSPPSSSRQGWSLKALHRLIVTSADLSAVVAGDARAAGEATRETACWPAARGSGSRPR